VAEVTPENEECLEDLVVELHGLLGPRADVKVHWTVEARRHIDGGAGVRWILPAARSEMATHDRPLINEVKPIREAHFDLMPEVYRRK
jgi:hypothetical protein